MPGSLAPVLKTRQIHCFQLEGEKSPGPEMRTLVTFPESYISACRTVPSIRLMTTRQVTDGSAVSVSVRRVSEWERRFMVLHPPSGPSGPFCLPLAV
jgi:hypothetical protein